MQDWEFLKPFIRRALKIVGGREITYEQIHEPRVRMIWETLTDLIQKQKNPNFSTPEQIEFLSLLRNEICRILDKEPAYLARFIWVNRKLAKKPAFNLYAHEEAF